MTATGDIPHALIEKLWQKHAATYDGALASYIPALAKANPAHFAIAVTTAAGQTQAHGDANVAFTLQSLSKPFVYGHALQLLGRERVHAHVGVEPTGEAFNSIIELEEQSHRPYNPMINSGAIAVTSLLPGDNPNDKRQGLLGALSRYAGRPLALDAAVFESERQTGHRNRAIAHLLRHFDIIAPALDETLDLYFQQCSVALTVTDLAMMAATLANDGKRPDSGERVLDSAHVRDVLSLMFTCGMYDSAGEWAYSVGLPAKSGVSGGLMVVVPGRMGIATYSPLLDARGHSVRGFRFFADLSSELTLSMFATAG